MDHLIETVKLQCQLLSVSMQLDASKVESQDLKKQLQELSYEDKAKEQILGEYESLIDQKEFSDVSFTVEGKTIHAHKCILVKSSPVLAAMFQHKMKEKLENVVEVEDIRYEVFVEMIRYMYIGKINDIEKIAVELVFAADKYALDRLKQACEQSLCENLNVDNAVDSLQLADQYRLDKLKVEAIEFIVSRAADFINKSKFKLLTHMPEVIFEVCQAMANKMN